MLCIFILVILIIIYFPRARPLQHGADQRPARAGRGAVRAADKEDPAGVREEYHH